MAHKPYATLSEATQCLMDSISIVRGGWDNVIAEKAAFMEHEHSIQGFIHSVVFGTSEGPFMAMAAEDESEFGAKLEEFATEFQACCPDEIPASALAEVTDRASAAGPGERKIDFKKWLNLFITYILPLLLKKS